MTDRELLEKAAKAAGIELLWFAGKWRNATGADPLRDTHSLPLWNPLTDDGDALRLAVRLRLNVMQGEYSCGANDEREVDVLEVFVGTDPYAATRRAIVRAAAALA